MKPALAPPSSSAVVVECLDDVVEIGGSVVELVSEVSDVVIASCGFG